MRVWQAVVLVDLALLLGIGWGWVRWGRPVEQLGQASGRARVAAIAAGVEQEWQVRGVVRAVDPSINVLVMTHEDIPGYMAPMTMGFRVASPEIQQSVSVGDEVRFTLRGIPPNVVVTAIERLR